MTSMDNNGRICFLFCFYFSFDESKYSGPWNGNPKFKAGFFCKWTKIFYLENLSLTGFLCV